MHLHLSGLVCSSVQQRWGARLHVHAHACTAAHEGACVGVALKACSGNAFSQSLLRKCGLPETGVLEGQVGKASWTPRPGSTKGGGVWRLSTRRSVRLCLHMRSGSSAWIYQRGSAFIADAYILMFDMAVLASFQMLVDSGKLLMGRQGYIVRCFAVASISSTQGPGQM